MPFCINCGQQLADGAKFCARCGSAVGASNHDQRQQEWAGTIIKCPSCGEETPSFSAICPSCGHEFRDTSSSNSIREFSTKIERTTVDSEKVSLIRTFPIANTKEDILEFMILASTNIENSFQADISEAWSVKFEQAYEKSKVLYGSLPEFDRCYELFVRKKKINSKVLKRKERVERNKVRSIERRKNLIQKKNQSEKNKERSSKFVENNKELILFFGSIILLFLIGFSIEIPHKIKEWQLNDLVNQVEECIANSDYENARIKAKQIIDDSNWSTDSKLKWNDIRESLLATIEKKESELIGKIPVNFNQKDLVGLQYTEVEQKLKQQGFTNVSFKTIEDLITGWITKEGQVEEVTINGRTDFDINTYFPHDVEIIISYHTFKSQ